MLLKLLKYDLRSMWKQFRVIWPAALILGLVNRFIFGAPTIYDGSFSLVVGNYTFAPNGGAFTQWLGVITMFLFFGVFVAMVLVSFIFVITRFYKGLLGDEGYLMHTLPVRSWQLVLSKLVCALVVTVVNAIVGVLALVLMMPLNWTELFDTELWRMILRALAKHPDTLLYFFEFCALFLTGVTLGALVLYLSMSIGHLFSSRRVLMSVVAYFGLNILGSTLNNLINRLGFPRWLAGLPVNSHGELWISIGLTLIPVVLMFLATSWILTHKLTLE